MSNFRDAPQPAIKMCRALFDWLTSTQAVSLCIRPETSGHVQARRRKPRDWWLRWRDLHGAVASWHEKLSDAKSATLAAGPIVATRLPGWTERTASQLSEVATLLPVSRHRISEIRDGLADDELVLRFHVARLDPERWRGAAVFAVDALASLRDAFPELSYVDDQALGWEPWRQRCEWRMDVEKWGLQQKYGLTRQQLAYVGNPAGFEAMELRGMEIQRPPAGIDVGQARADLDLIGQRYKSPITVGYLKDAITNFICGYLDEMVKVDRYLKRATPSHEMTFLADMVRHFQSEALPLELDDAPVMSDAPATGTRAAQAKLYNLRTACLRRLKDGQLELPPPFGFAAVAAVNAKANTEQVETIPDDLGPGDWLLPTLSLTEMASRLKNITPESVKVMLNPHGLRTYGSRQKWTVRLDKLPENTRRQLRGEPKK